MKTLYLLRHAKSTHNYPELSDKQRPLNKRGKRVLPLMSQAAVFNREDKPSIFSSPATRAIDTIQGIGKYSPMDFDIQVDDALYTFDMRDLLHWLQQQENTIQNLMIVGHNPALEDLLTWLTGTDIEAFPTCTLAELHINIDNWADLSKNTSSLQSIIKPIWTSYDEYSRKQDKEGHTQEDAIQLLHRIESLIPPTIVDLDREFLHQIRVAARKLKVLLNKTITDSPAKNELKSLLKQYIKKSNPVRDLDVMLENMQLWQKKLDLPAGHFTKITELVLDSRKKAHQAFSQYLQSSQHQTALEQSIQLCDQQSTMPETVIKNKTDKTTKSTTLEQLAAEHKKLNLQTVDDDIHKFRIRIKHYRYKLMAQGKKRKLCAKLSKLQSILGQHHDRTIQQQYLADFASNHADQALINTCEQLDEFIEQEKSSLKKAILASEVFDKIQLDNDATT